MKLSLVEQRSKRREKIVNILTSGKYSVNSSGEVFYAVKNKRVPTRRDKDVYLYLSLNFRKSSISAAVHQIVWIFYNGSYPADLTINHIDGNKLNNALANLELLSHSENQKHAHRIGLKSQKLDKNNNCKLTSKDVLKIRSNKKNSSPQELSKIFGVTSSAIRNILMGRTWRGVGV